MALCGFKDEKNQIMKSNVWLRMVSSCCNIRIMIIFAVKSLNPINASGCAFLSKLGRKLSSQSDNARETSYLPERDYVTFGYLPSQFRLSVCRLSVTFVHKMLVDSPSCTFERNPF